MVLLTLSVRFSHSFPPLIVERHIAPRSCGLCDALLWKTGVDSLILLQRSECSFVVGLLSDFRDKLRINDLASFVDDDDYAS